MSTPFQDNRSQSGVLLRALCVGVGIAVLGLAAFLPGLVRACADPGLTTTTLSGDPIEVLGNPAAEQYDSRRIYARNVWDMQVFDGRLYLGYGNSSNWGPATNAGPVPVWSFDPKTGQFSQEYVVTEEQIAQYRVLSGDLLIPGHDPKGESWQLGNFYRLRNGRWEKHRTIPGAVHTYDIMAFDGALFAAVAGSRRAGVELNSAEVARSTDEGKTWISYPIPGPGYTVTPRVYRAFTLFTLGGRLYVSAYQKDRRQLDTPPQIAVWEGNSFRGVQGEMFPDCPHSNEALVVKPSNHRDRLVYIGAESTNDHQWAPFGLFTASAIGKAEKLSIPGEATPIDIVVDEMSCYVLTNSKPAPPTDQEQYLIKVWSSDDLSQWSEVLAFAAPTFARSFERLDGDFYFGLGSEIAPQSSDAGKILRVRMAGGQR